jgi:LCP family protein required for cell wall assembly
VLDKKPDKQESLRSKANQSETKKQRSPKQKRLLTLTLGFAGAAALAATLGALLAVSLSSRPLEQNSTSEHLPNSPENLTDILPATLTHPVNLLVLGIDNDDSFVKPRLSTHPTSTDALASNTDTMLLVRFLPDNHQVNVLSIPRDTLVRLPGVGVAKIDSTNWRGGIKLAATTISRQLENVPIDRYIRISRNGFIHLVDALGGIEVTVPKKMDYVDKTQHLNIHFLPGKQLLNGQHLEEYVRFRHDKLGDIGRVQRQQEVLKAIQRTLLQPQTLAKLPTLLRIAQENIDTDLSLDEMLALAHAVLTNDRERNNFLMLPGRYSRRDEYSRSYWIENTTAASPILARYFDVHTHLGTEQVARSVSPSTSRHK